jgi:DNA topoisomerase-1
VTRLRRSDCSGPGITRRRRGRGFEYRDDEGRRITDPEVLARIGELGIPPAWKEVWVCPYPRGHLQATGFDAAGRKQYLAGADEPTRERVLACALRLLDRGFFRIGSEEYEDSYGLATMLKQHVALDDGGVMVFDFPAKSGRRRIQAVTDPEAAAVVEKLKRRRAGGPKLLAFKDGSRWRDLRSDDINAYLKAAVGGDYSAKDFRTWNGTVLAAVALAVSGEVAGSKTGRKRAIARAVNEVAHYLGNTPAVCRASYIDPRVFDAYRGGLIIRPVLEQAVEGERGELPIHHRAVEEAVLDLINERERSPAIERLAA